MPGQHSAGKVRRQRSRGNTVPVKEKLHNRNIRKMIWSLFSKLKVIKTLPLKTLVPNSISATLVSSFCSYLTPHVHVPCLHPFITEEALGAPLSLLWLILTFITVTGCGPVMKRRWIVLSLYEFMPIQDRGLRHLQLKGINRNVDYLHLFP